jgi:hypothetical protein
LSYMPISTYLRSNIHQNGFEILKVNIQTKVICFAYFNAICIIVKGKFHLH